MIITSTLLALALLHSEAFAAQLLPENLCQAIVKAYSGCDTEVLFTLPHTQVIVGKKSLSCSDGKKLEFYVRRENMDLASMLSLQYEAGITSVPETRPSQDPGRLRNVEFFKALYGSSARQVTANLAEVDFLGQKVLFNKRQGAANALSAVSRELLEMTEKDSELKKYLAPWISGQLKFNGSHGQGSSTFRWRNVAGSDRLSDHSFGVAIDIYNPKLRAPYYWLWEIEKTKPLKREEDFGVYIPTKMVQVPWNLVKTFEKFGFIWGGKWNHFDAMHFEFRPEFFPGLKRSCGNP